MGRLIEVTLRGEDAVCIDPNQGLFRPGRPDGYAILCRVPDAWAGAADLPDRLRAVAGAVNADQTAALLEQGSLVGHFLLRSIDYRLLEDGDPAAAGPCYLVDENGSYRSAGP